MTERRVLAATGGSRSGASPASANLRNSRARQAYTLIELLLVLAVILAFVGMSWPALSTALRKSRLREAARQVRIALIKARLQAIESATLHEFRFQPGQRTCEFGPATSFGEAEDLAAATSESLDAAGDESSAQRGLSLAAAVQMELPDGVWFGEPDSSGAVLLEPPPDAFGDAQWSAPILFHPNGAAANARIRLCGPRGSYVDVTLRGLTGVAEVGELQRDEAPR